jgi:hypothetical protein
MQHHLMALAVVALCVGAAPAHAATPAAAGPSASAPSGAPAPKRLRHARPKRVVAPGAVGGTPETSARVPGGPPPGTPNGLTVPIPSLKN